MEMQINSPGIKQNRIPMIISLICFAYLASFLVRFGEVFGRGSDMVSNTAYGRTMFGDVYCAGWSVPKPSQMILFGLTYRITGSLWFVNILFVVAAALLIYFACRIIGRNYGVPVPYMVFAALVVMTPFSFGAAVGGGSGLLNTLFTFIALAYTEDLSRLRNRVLVIIFLSMASLTRPENWVNTYLVIFCLFALKYAPRNRPGFSKSDLLLLIPLTMPLTWHLMDYAVFGNIFYGRWLAQRFAIEYATRHDAFEWHKYPGMVKAGFFQTFYLSSWLSIRTITMIILSLVGVVTIFIKQRRMLLLLACSFFGTIAFYFVAYINEMLFLSRFMYYNYIFIFFVISVGIAQLCSFFLYIPVRYLRNAVQIALACAIVLYIVYTPFKTGVMGSLIPGFKARAEVVRKENRAIRALAEDVEPGDKPVILTTLYIACSRIVLELGTGKDIYLMERVVGLERLGVKDYLPDFEGRTIYLAYHGSVSGNIRDLIERIEKNARKVETIFQGDGLEIRKCS
jgi:hypothetical protein